VTATGPKEAVTGTGDLPSGSWECKVEAVEARVAVPDLEAAARLGASAGGGRKSIACRFKGRIVGPRAAGTLSVDMGGLKPVAGTFLNRAV
jgi:hypothetical protein